MAKKPNRLQDLDGDARSASLGPRLGEAAFRSFCESAHEGILVVEVSTRQLIYANPAFAQMFGYAQDEILKLSVADLHPPQALRSVDRDFEMLVNGELDNSTQPCLRKDGSVFHGQIHAWPFTVDGRLCAAGFFEDITERKLAEKERKQIDWMLTDRAPAVQSAALDKDAADQGYGDVTALNRDGLILRSVDKGTLNDITAEYLNLLETSSAIYEKNGDYAYGIFSSGWCRLMDSASRKLCQTDDNEAALACGKWLCHESCWTDCSKRAIESQSPVDIECHGGIRLYAVPIFSGGEVIGAINFGYGVPPSDPAKLKSLADSYGLDAERLAREADAYASRPAYIVELAKQRLVSSARLIGVMVERKQAEEALRRSESLFQTMLALIPDMISIHDPQMNIVYSNWNGFAAVAPEKRVLGEKCHRVYRGLDSICPDCRAKQVLETREPYAQEVELPEGRWIDLHVIPILNEDGNCELFVEWVRDITERKATEDRLRQMEKMDAVGRLAGGVAHDFNNMLQTILGYCDMLLADTGSDHPFRESLEEIRDAGRRSADLTRQLLAFARKQTVAPIVLDVNAAVSDALKMLDRLVGENIDLLWQPCRDKCLVNVDPAQLDQILANLIVNSRDAIVGNGRITIETARMEFGEEYCRTHPDFRPGRYNMLAVSDDGAGMDRQTVAQVFEPFFTTKDIDKGTGLGLATVYGIIKQNDGFINIYSEPGHGTTVRAYLPAVSADHEPTRRKPNDDKQPTGTETVLLVEDEPALLKLSQQVLEGLGYKVLAASEPQEALSIATGTSCRFDVLITDVVMPQMSGRELQKRLAEHCPGIRCLFMSGYTENVIAHHGVLEKGVYFLQKPFSTADLARKLREVLEADG